MVPESRTRRNTPNSNSSSTKSGRHRAKDLDQETYEVYL